MYIIRRQVHSNYYYSNCKKLEFKTSKDTYQSTVRSDTIQHALSRPPKSHSILRWRLHKRHCQLITDNIIKNQVTCIPFLHILNMNRLNKRLLKISKLFAYPRNLSQRTIANFEHLLWQNFIYLFTIF